MTAPGLRARLDQLAQLHQAGDATPWGLSACSDCKVIDQDGMTAATTALPDDAALIVAAVNALPALLSVVRGVADLEGRCRKWARVNAELARQDTGGPDLHDGMRMAQEATADRLSSLLAPLTEGNPTT